MTRERAERCLELRLKVRKADDIGHLVTVMNHTALVAWDNGGETWEPLGQIRQK